MNSRNSTRARGLLVASSVVLVAASLSAPAGATVPHNVGAKVAAKKSPVRVSVKLTSVKGSKALFTGVVKGGPRSGMVILQKKAASGAWRKVSASDYTPKGYSVTYAAETGKYRVKVRTRTWYNHTRWFQQEAGWRWTGPAVVHSKAVTINRQVADPAPPVQWVVGLGDSYASGEGASYAGYGPAAGANQSSLLPADSWWITAFGNSLKETYPGDYKQPIAQPGLPQGNADKYEIPLSGRLCHRSSSAMMYWNQSNYAAVNLACSGATSNTNLKTGKPGIDFVTGDCGVANCGKIVGQAQQLQNFASQVRENRDNIAVVSYSIGGNDANFAELVSDCVDRFVKKRSSCADDSSSVIRREFNNGNGLTAARDAVYNAGKHILQAMDAAGIPRGSYVIDMQTPPVGLPPASEFQPAYGDGWRRQGAGGCGFSDNDLNFVNGPFGEVLRYRFLEGAEKLLKENPDIKMTVTDATNSFAQHQLCSKFLNYPSSDKYGTNTLTPEWAGAFGGQRGTWMSPIIAACVGTSTICFDTLVKNDPQILYPNLWKAVDGKGAYESPDWYASIDELKQLPMHPNFWGQRALAQCHSKTATDKNAVGKIYECSPPTGDTRPLDATGRPTMNTSNVGDITNPKRPQAKTFTLASKLGDGSKCIGRDLADLGQDGYNLVLRPCRVVRDKWQLFYWGADGTLRMNTKDKGVTCVTSKDVAKDKLIWINKCDGSPAQKVRMEGDRLKIGNYCLGVSDGRWVDYRAIITWDCIANTDQTWDLRPDWGF